NKMVCAQRGLPLAQLEKHIEDGSLDLAQMEDGFSAPKDFAGVRQSKGRPVRRGSQVVKGLSTNEKAIWGLDHFAEYPRKIIVDCTDSELVASKYPEWLQRGFHIITPNRQILTAPSEQYEECFKYVGHLESIYFDLSRRDVQEACLVEHSSDTTPPWAGKFPSSHYSKTCSRRAIE
ncbi:Bifunctional aspartokinase/homoserine dehydrogenase, partial [Durusdinium trenchii]